MTSCQYSYYYEVYLRIQTDVGLSKDDRLRFEFVIWDLWMYLIFYHEGANLLVSASRKSILKRATYVCVYVLVNV